LSTDQEVDRVASLLEGNVFFKNCTVWAYAYAIHKQFWVAARKISTYRHPEKQYPPVCESQCQYAEVMQVKIEGGELYASEPEAYELTHNPGSGETEKLEPVKRNKQCLIVGIEPGRIRINELLTWVP
jgi:hypothetical protein